MSTETRLSIAEQRDLAKRLVALARELEAECDSLVEGHCLAVRERAEAIVVILETGKASGSHTSSAFRFSALPADCHVPGMNWHNPCAPTGDLANGFSPLSAIHCAFSKYGSVPGGKNISVYFSK